LHEAAYLDHCRRFALGESETRTANGELAAAHGLA
jgi:hypothetical protein